jgi:2-hydroxychromene-2-carboxylate isomerase
VVTAQVEFFFDFISPYSYLAWPRVRALCRRRGVGLVLHPVLFAALLNHGGQRGPAEIPAKREWLVTDCLRLAALQGVPFTFPAHHPFNPVTALRVALPEVAGDRQEEVVDALWSAGWASGIDLGSADALALALDGRGLDGRGLVARANDPAAKEALRRHTSDAIARGVFGVPTMLAADRLFWGNDRIEHLELALDGRDPLDPARVPELLARSAAAVRERPAPGS